MSERSLAGQLSGRANVHLLGDCDPVATILEATDRALFLAGNALNRFDAGKEANGEAGPPPQTSGRRSQRTAISQA